MDHSLGPRLARGSDPRKRAPLRANAAITRGLMDVLSRRELGWGAGSECGEFGRSSARSAKPERHARDTLVENESKNDVSSRSGEEREPRGRAGARASKTISLSSGGGKGAGKEGENSLRERATLRRARSEARGTSRLRAETKVKGAEPESRGVAGKSRRREGLSRDPSDRGKGFSRGPSDRGDSRAARKEPCSRKHLK